MNLLTELEALAVEMEQNEDLSATTRVCGHRLRSLIAAEKARGPDEELPVMARPIGCTCQDYDPRRKWRVDLDCPAHGYRDPAAGPDPLLVQAREALEKLRRSHDYVDGDCWYSCQKHPEYCGDGDRNLCTCGADVANALIDKTIAALDERLGGKA